MIFIKAKKVLTKHLLSYLHGFVAMFALLIIWSSLDGSWPKSWEDVANVGLPLLVFYLHAFLVFPYFLKRGDVRSYLLYTFILFAIGAIAKTFIDIGNRPDYIYIFSKIYYVDLEYGFNY
ncbi:hypothetical protein FUAX_49400 (plasmid) [Fulvitalea axinellae]|uniref:Uncharacterized protein n=1 Tax=Fulvitalea axinellae TaxID=1182444 RepID=A0AAU9CQN5_9BACT|nr:hypothetical protein FUAX_49400 [Fulvitalea axinellae]